MRSPTKGWKRVKASTRSKMPASCFLEPKRRAYVICPASTKRPSCKGLLVAFSRARQQHRPQIVDKALRKAAKMGCDFLGRGKANELATRKGLVSLAGAAGAADCGCGG